MNLKPTGYEAVYEGYIYTFGYMSHNKKWIVCRRPEGKVQIPPFTEVLNLVDGKLKWEFVLSRDSYQDRAKYDNEVYAAADIEAMAAGHRPSPLCDLA